MPTGVTSPKRTPEEMLAHAKQMGREINSSRPECLPYYDAWIEAEHIASNLHRSFAKKPETSLLPYIAQAEETATCLYRVYLNMKYGVSDVFGIIG